VIDATASAEQFKKRQLRFGRTVRNVCFAFVGLFLLAAWRNGDVFGVPLRAALPLTFAYGLAVILAYGFVDALRYNLVYTRSGIIDRKTRPSLFVGYLVLMGVLSLGATGAATFLVIYSRAHPGVV
jgi:hypothetical protein